MTIVNGKFKRITNSIRFIVILVLLLVIALFPFYWMLVTSIRSDAEVYQTKQSLMPKTVTTFQYKKLLTTTNFLIYFRNSLMVAVSTTLIALIIGFPAAFTLTFLRVRGGKLIARFVFFAYLVPPILVFIPMFSLVNSLRLTNTLFSLVLTYLTFSVPFVTWLLLSYFRSIPTSLMDAALIDGCTKFATMRLIVLPLSGPGVATAGIFAFTLAWNEFLFALTFVTSDKLRTIPVGISGLIMGDVYQWGMIMASAIMASIPAIVFYIIAQRFVISGLTAGSVKG